MPQPVTGEQYVSHHSSAGAAVLEPEEAGLEQLGLDRAKLLDLVPQPVIAMDCDHTILYVNEAAAQAAGLAARECIGRKSWDVFENQTCREGACAAAQAVRTGKACSGETIPTVQGKPMAVRVTASPVFDRQQRAIGVIEVLNPAQAGIDATEEIFRLAEKIREGKLGERARVDGFEGRHRRMMQDVNGLLDAIVMPLRVSAEYVNRLGKGDVPPKITEIYKGEFEEIKSSLNNCIDGLSGLAEANTILQRMAVNDYTRRIEGSYSGIFAELCRAVNESLERLVSVFDAVRRIAHGDFTRLAEAKRVGKRSEQDEVVPALVLTMESLKALVEDAENLAKAAGDGRLNQRIDISRHEGEYKKVVQGMNLILEMFVEPLRVASQNAAMLASSSEEMSAVSEQLAGNAEETAAQANLVSAASEQVSGNVTSVSQACEQMQSSIREIGKNANESARVAKSAVQVADTTNRTISKLGESSKEIGNVIKVITSIAQQTNLLALNATIEAARAGEAGKGFAVVANEVKELAKQTATATEDIGRKIEAIQADTHGAVKAIGEIGSIINTINDVSNSIATAVEEQTVTTNEIVRSVNEAAKGVDEIAKNVGGVAVAAKNTTQGATDTQQASRELSSMASRMQQAISKFAF